MNYKKVKLHGLAVSGLDTCSYSVQVGDVSGSDGIYQQVD